MTPLDGLRVVDLTRNVSGPTVTRILANLGAEVVKVERPPGGDDARVFPPMHDGRSLIFEWCNAGKRSVAIDMAMPDGVAVFRRLVEKADVMIHSFAPGVVERLGIAESDVRAWQPELLYCGLSAFGDGPVGKAMKGYDPIVQAFTGIMDMTGYPDGPPARCAPSIVDIGNGLWMTIGILSALLSGEKGQPVYEIETALVDSAMACIPWQATEGLLTNRALERRGAGHSLGAPYDLFPASDQMVFMSAANQGLWLKLSEILGEPYLADDPRFAGPLDRTEHRLELTEVLGQRLQAKTAAEWVELLVAAGIPAAVVQGVNQAVRHAVAGEREWFQHAGDLPLVRLPIIAGRQPLPPVTAAPAIGEHTIEVLQTLGMSESELDRLLAAKVIVDGGVTVAS
jgi:crotonobetainyl-CoA:carnitine CoA-transferase CaiB-like acyl-CoA transferase